MDRLKKHVDTVIVLGGILSSVLWMNSRLGDIEKEISNIDKEVAIIKTVLILKNIMPTELAHKNEEIELNKEKK